MAVTSRAEQYRWVARDCRLMAESLPAGQNRCALLEMAEVWERLADSANASYGPEQKTGPVVLVY
jgi:hypothetical protein